MTDIHTPFAVFAALSALGVFAFGSPDVRAQLGIGATESPAYAPAAISHRPETLPRIEATGATVMQVDGPRTLPPDAAATIVARARHEVEAGVKYDASYRMLSTYPNGDIPLDRGACTDVVVRAFRAVGVDLQVLVHDDILSNRDFYGADADANVDHRRAPTLYAYFSRHTDRLPDRPAKDASSFEPGDVVFYSYHKCYSRFPCAADHVAVVSDRIGPRGLPLVLQNGGPQATESDSLDHGKMIGHFRFPHVVPSAAHRSAR